MIEAQLCKLRGTLDLGFIYCYVFYCGVCRASCVLRFSSFLMKKVVSRCFAGSSGSSEVPLRIWCGDPVLSKTQSVCNAFYCCTTESR